MASISAGTIKLFVLGDARIETPRGEIEPNAQLVFAAGLYLILERKEPVSRRALENLLWPDVISSTASHRLRQTLHKMRQFGFPVEAVGKTRLTLAASGIASDYEDIVAPRKRDHAVPLERFKLLPGYEPNFSPAFLDWLDEKKRDIHGILTRVILASIAEKRLMGQWSEVEALVRTLLQFAPYNEEGTLVLAEAYAMRGAKLDAVRVLDDYISEVGSGPTELRLPATIMRRRIADRLTQNSHPKSGEIPLIGRSEPMAELCCMLHLLREKRGAACLVWGEAGIGKSRLLAELSAFAGLQGITTVRTQCRPGDSHRPLSVFIDLVPVLRGMRGAIGCSPETMKYLDRLTHHRNDDPAPVGLPGDAEFVYAKVQRALFDLIDAVSDETPLLILIEDIHRLDQVSVNLLADIIPWGSGHPILFAFSGRDREYPWIDSLNETVKQLRLPPLDIASSREVMAATITQYDRDISQDYLSWCVRVAEGNPYFLIELTSHWIESGEEQVAPPSLQAVTSQRIARLEGPTLQLLQTCALLDKNSTIDRIEGVLGFDHYRLLQSINDLGNLGMLVLEHTDSGNDPSDRLAPRHELLANAAERALTPPARAFLHRRIGTVLEAEIGNNPSAAILWECAKHWQLAGNTVRAYSVARSCATHLMELGLCGAAAEAYEKSLSFCESDWQRLETLEGQAIAYFRASDWRNLSTTASKVRRLQGYLRADFDGHDEVELMELRSMWQRGDLDGVRNRASACLECVRAANDHRLRAGIMTLMLLDLECDHDAIRHTYDALKPLLSDGKTDPAYRFEASMVFESVCGDVAMGVKSAELLIDARRHSQSVADLIRALTNGSVAARTGGRIDLARSWLHEALAQAVSHKLPLATEVPMQTLASIALDQNEIEEAKGWYSKLVMLPQTPHDAMTIRDSIGLRIALCDLDAGTARRLVHGDLHQLANDANPHRRTYGLALLVAVELAERRVPNPEALSCLEEAHLKSRRNARQAFATFVLVTGLRVSGRRRRANHLLREYLNHYRREPVPAPLHVLDLMESFQTPSTG